MYEREADEIFAKAGVSKEGKDDDYREICFLLAQAKAYQSVTYGLSRKRLAMWKAQKEALIQDLRELYPEECHASR